MNKKILFLTLKVFSAAGGVERVCRIAAKALYELYNTPENIFKVYSMYGTQADFNDLYLPAINFKGFNKQKSVFVGDSIRQGIKSDVVILSHVNLLIVGVLIKILSPKTKIILIAHGIEVWKNFPAWKKYIFHYVDLILAVSHFTRERMIVLNHFNPDKILVLNNCLDPFLQPPKNEAKNKGLLSKYGLSDTDIVLLTLSRLSITEKYKGYDEVIVVMNKLSIEYPHLKYLLVGKYDQKEKSRIDRLITEAGLQKFVVLTGYIPDGELAAYYNLADIFIMPSKKEGFGIAFIEAMYYNKPVIAGNKDGSVDALCNGKLGLLVDPDNEEDISNAIKKIITNRQQYLPDRNILMKHFSYDVYKNNLQYSINSLYT